IRGYKAITTGIAESKCRGRMPKLPKSRADESAPRYARERPLAARYRPGGRWSCASLARTEEQRCNAVRDDDEQRESTDRHSHDGHKTASRNGPVLLSRIPFCS